MVCAQHNDSTFLFEEQTCRVGGPDEPDCLFHFNKCLLLSNVVSIWMKAWIHLRGILFRDLTTQMLHRSLQHEIVAMVTQVRQKKLILPP